MIIDICLSINAKKMSSLKDSEFHPDVITCNNYVLEASLPSILWKLLFKCYNKQHTNFISLFIIKYRFFVYCSLNQANTFNEMFKFVAFIVYEIKLCLNQ